MAESLFSIAQAHCWNVPGWVLFSILHLLGVACFSFIVAKRLVPLFRSQPDVRFDRPLIRLSRVMKYWLGQWRHPRYRTSGALHVLIFAGFLILISRAFYVLGLGISDHLVIPGIPGVVAQIYDVLKDYATTVVLICVTVAAIRRGIFRPARYAVPIKQVKDGTADAIFLLAMIGVLMVADSVFEASKAAAPSRPGEAGHLLATLSLPWLLQNAFAGASLSTLSNLYFGSYLLHEFCFFFLLCYRPFGVQFHVETSLFSIYFAKLDPGTIKPVRWGVPEEQLAQLKSFGVKTIEDFTWKHILDFYSCADCGRCSDQCPSHAAGRPLSPRFFTTKARDYVFQSYPVLGKAHNGTPLVGSIYSEDEIWSCTTCGACEAECPLLVEYIDKIVDLRRGMIDDGNVPQSLQKPLKALESRGNPYGKMEKKRADWCKAKDFQQTCQVRILNPDQGAETLYFVDSITSYDDRIQAIGRATATLLKYVGSDFGILGPAERDSGHEVRRFGEETLFMALRDHNVDAIRKSGVQRIVTADPHAFNALQHDYHDMPPVEHISQTLQRAVRAGNLKLSPVDGGNSIYAYHDPCYLGRHNGVYDAPRDVLDAIPGLKRVEMSRCRDRSFCCGGGGLMLFYEPKEEERMGVKRVRMAAEAGANVIVTACPFCMVNLEDAIKVSGMEGKMAAIDLTELVEHHLNKASQELVGGRTWKS